MKNKIKNKKQKKKIFTLNYLIKLIPTCEHINLEILNSWIKHKLTNFEKREPLNKVQLRDIGYFTDPTI